MTDDFLSRLSSLHNILIAEKLTNVECPVQATWGVNEGWEMDPEFTMGIYEEFTYIEATAYPAGIDRPIFGMQKKVEALLFYGSVAEFIEFGRNADGDQPYDEIEVNPGNYGLDRDMYRGSTIQTMQADQRNDSIACVNTHLLKFGEQPLRLSKSHVDAD